jgi:threonine dehydrogenase-like Zn-dependent dehydrogenase/glycosyltransferase involved in cell wall biosynthesis
MAPVASVVVRAFNEARHLPRLIDGLASQEYRDFETILVDSGSTDETVELGREAFDRVIEIDSADFTFGYSLNRGCAAAAGRYIVIVSAHCYPADEHWLGRLVAALDGEEQAALAYGNQLPVEETKFSERREFERLFGPERRVQKAPDYFCNNANAAIRRELWEQHPYDEALTGNEDVAWARHWLDRGRTIVYEPDAGVHHVHEETWEQIERRYYREAFARRSVGLEPRRQAPGKLLFGVREWARDLAALRDSGQLGRRSVVEVTRYRSRQTRGELWGLVHDYNAVREHHGLFFDKGDTAVVINGPGDSSLTQRALPEVKPNDVLIRVAYVGVCATDLEVLDGSLGYYRNGRARYPITPGHEYSGVVVKKGANVDDRIGVGDKVVGACILGCGRCAACLAGNPIACPARREVGVMNHDGAYAEHVVLRSEHVHPLRPDADLAAHALVEPLAVVHKGLGRLGALNGSDAGARYAVIGAGPIGHLVAQMLVREGRDVTVFDRDSRRLEALPSGVAGEGEITGLSRFDAVVEATGSRDALEQVLAGSAVGARLLLLGFPYGETTYNFENVVAADRAILGSVGSGPHDFEAAIGVLPELDLSPLTSSVYPLERYEDAWTAHRERTAVKVLLAVHP